MTNENTSVFSTGHSSQDLLYGEAVILGNRRAPSANRFQTFRIPDGKGGQRMDAISWEVYIADLSGGLDVDIDEIGNRMRSVDGLDHRFPRTLFLAPLAKSAATPDPSSILNMSMVDIFDTTAIGIGTSLLIPTSATDRDPATRTFTPNGAGSITYLYRGTIGGTTDQLWVCNDGESVEILSDLGATPTSAGSIASTNPCWGVIESPLNDDTPGANSHLMNVGNTIALKRSDNTLATAPTVVLNNWHGGGYPVHHKTFSLGGRGRLSAFWVKPRTHLTTSMLSDATKLGDIYYTNAEGTDPLPLDLPIPVRLARKWKNGIVASDGRSVFWHNGNIEDLHFGYEFEPVTEREYLIYNIDTYFDRLIVWVAERNVSSDAQTRIAMFEYIPESDAWYQLTGWISSTGALIAGATTQIAREHSTVYRNATAYAYDGATWRYFHLTPPNWNPFYMSGNTGSATAGVVYEYDASGVAKGGIWPLPGLESYPSIVYEVQCLGDVKGTGADVKVEVANQTNSGMSFTNSQAYHFEPSDVVDAESWRKNMSRHDSSPFSKLQLQITITRGSETRISSNALPLIVRGITFLDGKVRASRELV